MSQETGCDGGKLNHLLGELTVASRCEHDNDASDVTGFIFWLRHFWLLKKESCFMEFVQRIDLICSNISTAIRHVVLYVQASSKLTNKCWVHS